MCSIATDSSNPASLACVGGSACIKQSFIEGVKKTEIEINPSKKGAASGVVAGAIVGSPLGPAGAAVGAVIGGIVGYVFGPEDKKDNK